MHWNEQVVLHLRLINKTTYWSIIVPGRSTLGPMYDHACHVACCQNLAETHDAKLVAWQEYIVETLPDMCLRHAITDFAISVLSGHTASAWAVCS